MIVAEYAASHFNDHAEQLTSVLHRKAEVMAEVVNPFGNSVEFTMPKGGIFMWPVFAEDIDTAEFSAAAARNGIEFNAGAWLVG